MKPQFLVVCLAFLCSWTMPAAAEEVAETSAQWRILGPAFSYHSNTNDAPLVSSSKVVTDCSFTGKDFCRDVYVRGEQKWSGNNPSIGIEWSQPSSEGSTGRDRIFGSLVRDSFGKPGLMAGVGRTWEVAQFGSFNVQAGVGGGWWLRTVNVGKTKDVSLTRCTKAGEFSRTICPGDSLPAETVILAPPLRPLSGPQFTINRIVEPDPQYRLIPFVLPLLSITESRTGLGVNVSVIPKFKIGKYQVASATTVLFQLTYLF